MNIIKDIFREVANWFSRLSATGWVALSAIIVALPTYLIYAGYMDISSWGIKRIEEVCFSWAKELNAFYTMNSVLVDTLLVILPIVMAALVYFSIKPENQQWAIAVNMFVFALVGFSAYWFYRACVNHYDKILFVIEGGKEKSAKDIDDAYRQAERREAPVSQHSAAFNSAVVQDAQDKSRRAQDKLTVLEIIEDAKKTDLAEKIRRIEKFQSDPAVLAREREILDGKLKQAAVAEINVHDGRMSAREIGDRLDQVVASCKSMNADILDLNPLHTGSSPTETLAKLRAACIRVEKKYIIAYNKLVPKGQGKNPEFYWSWGNNYSWIDRPDPVYSDEKGLWLQGGKPLPPGLQPRPINVEVFRQLKSKLTSKIPMLFQHFEPFVGYYWTFQGHILPYLPELPDSLEWVRKEIFASW